MSIFVQCRSSSSLASHESITSLGGRNNARRPSKSSGGRELRCRSGPENRSARSQTADLEDAFRIMAEAVGELQQSMGSMEKKVDKTMQMAHQANQRIQGLERRMESVENKIDASLQRSQMQQQQPQSQTFPCSQGNQPILCLFPEQRFNMSSPPPFVMHPPASPPCPPCQECAQQPTPPPPPRPQAPCPLQQYAPPPYTPPPYFPPAYPPVPSQPQSSQPPCPPQPCAPPPCPPPPCLPPPSPQPPLCLQLPPCPPQPCAPPPCKPPPCPPPRCPSPPSSPEVSPPRISKKIRRRKSIPERINYIIPPCPPKKSACVLPRPVCSKPRASLSGIRTPSYVGMPTRPAWKLSYKGSGCR